MKQLNYIGFNNQICKCDYATGTVDGLPVLVVKQLHDSKFTTITNLIETITSQILAGDLFGTDANALRVFEFYSPSLDPVVSWQEVSFGGIAKRQPRKTMIQMCVELFKPTEQPYVVWNPSWHAVSLVLQRQLARFDPALV